VQPFHDVRAQYAAHREEIDAAIRGVLESGEYILGRALARFESEFSRYLGAGHTVGVGSGMAALELALRALGIGAGDEVIVPAFTAVPTAMAVVEVGAVPRLADVDLDTFTLDPASVANEIGPQTRAVIPVHLYGQCADLDAIRDLAEPRGIALVEDAAQAHGATLGGRPAGSLAPLACFSFYPTKNLGSFGDAGAVVAADPALAARVRALRNYGNAGGGRFLEPGTNARLDDLHAAILSAKLPHLEAWNALRRAHAAAYREALAGCALDLPRERPGGGHAYHQFVVRSRERDALRARLAERGIETLVHYPYAIHEVEALRERVRFRERPLRAERAAREVLSLPIYPELPPDHLAQVIAALRAAAA
jgi:dTDP-3-amino-3,4,6-trideoxy-alpha-D-glucose transaminase